MVIVQRDLTLLFRPNMLRDTVCIVHQSLRLMECIGVDFLHDIGLTGVVRLAEINLVGLVYISDLDVLVANVFPRDAKGIADAF